MPYNGSGTFDPLSPPTFPAVPGTPISATYFNNIINDILQQGLSLVLVRDGQAAMLANLNLGNNRLVAVADPVDLQDAATKAYADTKLPLSGGVLTGDLTLSNTEQLRFRNAAGSNSFVFVASAGDVLTLTNPAGTVLITAAAGASPAATYGSGADNGITFDEAADTASLEIGGVVTLTAASGGFGFGNTNPTVRVDVSAADAVSGNGVRVRANATAAAARLTLTTSDAATEWGFFAATNTETALGAAGSRELRFQTNGTTRLTITSAGVVNYGTQEIGYRDLPIAAAFTRGQCWPITAGVTVDTGTAGSLISLYNDTSGNLTITQGTGVTLRLTGTNTTGNRTLLPRGVINLWYRSATEVIASGSIT